MVLAEQNSAVTTGDRATVLSVYSMCGSVAAASVNPLIGLFADRSVQAGLLICAAAILLLALYIKSVKKTGATA
jgi:hypothetical protein